jgi:hypothetical protein
MEAHRTMNRARRLLTAFVVFGMAACTEIVPEAADSPTGPEVQMSQSEAAVTAPALGVSTTCQSFQKELDAVNEQLSADANSTELQEKQAALSAIVADVCN